MHPGTSGRNPRPDPSRYGQRGWLRQPRLAPAATNLCTRVNGFDADGTRQTRSRSDVRCRRHSRGAFTTVAVSPFPDLVRCRRRDTSAQTSPKCQISSASFAISFTFSGKRLCVSARTKMRQASLGLSCMSSNRKSGCSGHKNKKPPR